MRRLVYWLGLLSGFVLLVIMGLMCAEVFCRYFLHKPILGTVEISSYLLVLFVFSGVSYTQSIDGHIRIDLLTSRLSDQSQKLLRLAALMMALAVYGVITWRTSRAFLLSWQMGEVRWGALPLPVYPVKFFVAFGSLVLCIQFIISIFDECRYKLFCQTEE
jgi:TRAP-type C4-dicarboxylate transport system permease small subunit